MSFRTGVDQSSSIRRFELLIAPGAPLKNRGGDFLRFALHLAGRHDPIDEPDFLSATGVNQLGGQEQLAEIAFAELATQKCHYQAGHEAATNFRVTELGLLGGNDEIAGGHDAGSAGHRRAVNRGDGDEPRFGQGE